MKIFVKEKNESERGGGGQRKREREFHIFQILKRPIERNKPTALCSKRADNNGLGKRKKKNQEDLKIQQKKVTIRCFRKVIF